MVHLWINLLVNGLLELKGPITLGRGGLGGRISEGSFLESGAAGWLVAILENDGQTIDVAVHFQTLDRQRRQAGQIPIRDGRINLTPVIDRRPLIGSHTKNGCCHSTWICAEPPSRKGKCGHRRRCNWPWPALGD